MLPNLQETFTEKRVSGKLIFCAVNFTAVPMNSFEHVATDSFKHELEFKFKFLMRHCTKN